MNQDELSGIWQEIASGGKVSSWSVASGSTVEALKCAAPLQLWARQAPNGFWVELPIGPLGS